MKTNGFVNAKRIFSALAIVAVLVCALCVFASANDAALEVGNTNLKYDTYTHIIVTLNGEPADGALKGIAVWTPDVEEPTAENVSYFNFVEETDPKGVKFFATRGIPASELSEIFYIAPAVRDANGNESVAGEMVAKSAFGYVEERLGDDNLKGYQVDIYRDLVVYGTAAEQVLGDKTANRNVVVAQNGYVGNAISPLQFVEGETALLRAPVQNAKGEYFAYWADAFGKLVTGERVANVDVNAGLNWYNAVYTDKDSSAYGYFADFQSFELGEYNFKVGDLNDDQKAAGKASLTLPMFKSSGSNVGFRKMMVLDTEALAGLDADAVIPTTASDSLSFKSTYDGIKYLNYVKNSAASYEYTSPSIVSSGSTEYQTKLDRFEIELDITSSPQRPTTYIRFIDNTVGTTSDIVLTFGRSVIDDVECIRIEYDTIGGENHNLYIPTAIGKEVACIGVDIDANGVVNIYVNGEKVELDAPVARMVQSNGVSYVAVPAGNYNPTRFMFETSTGYAMNYNIYSIGLVDTDKIEK